MTVYTLDEREGLRVEVCDHEGAAEVIDTPEIVGVRCTECDCAWWQNKSGPHFPDPQWLAPFTRIVAVEVAA